MPSERAPRHRANRSARPKRPRHRDETLPSSSWLRDRPEWLKRVLLVLIVALIAAVSLLVIVQPASWVDWARGYGLWPRAAEPAVASPLQDFPGISRDYRSNGEGAFPEGREIPAGFVEMRLDETTVAVITPCANIQFVAALERSVLVLEQTSFTSTDCDSADAARSDWVHSHLTARPTIQLAQGRLTFWRSLNTLPKTREELTLSVVE